MSASFDLGQFFAEGGFAMYLVLLVGGLGHALALAALGSMMAKRRSVPLILGAATLLLAVVTMCTGVGGYLLGMRAVDEVLMNVEPELRAEIYEVGHDEADNNLYFGGCAFLFPMLAGLTAVLRGATMRDGPPSA